WDFFFFSSGRRHTRSKRDWSSDVCSSDLTAKALADAFRAFDADSEASVAVLFGEGGTFCAGADLKAFAEGAYDRVPAEGDGPMRSEERRVGKEGSTGWWSEP